MTKPAPYPADTRAKGWRFELDHERIRQSDTWSLASAEVRPWLLMLWMVAWEQAPCGSMPADDQLIAARIGMAPKAFAKHRSVLMRGWWLADDGRLYQDTIVERVREMLDYKTKEKTRKAAYRDRMSANVPRDKHGTDAGQTRQSGVSDATGTGTGTSITSSSHTSGTPAPDVCVDNSKPSGTPAGLICKALKHAGMPAVSPQHPELLALIERGVTQETFAQAAATAVSKGKDFAYMLGIVKRQLESAATIGSLPAAVPHGTQDPDSRAAIEAEGVAKGLGKWDDTKEHWPAYKARVRGANLPAVDPSIAALVSGAIKTTGARA